MTYLDTHVAVWLYAGDIKRISTAARREIDRSKSVLLSAATILELELLYEIGRIKVRSAEITATLYKDLGVRVCGVAFDKVAFEAADIGWTREPFDRMIVANALVQKASLVTKDEMIRKHCVISIW